MRACLSVVLNVTEGAAKRTEKDRTRFYNIAYASSKEVQAILALLNRSTELKLADQVSASLYRLHNRIASPPTA